jgi:hypothetical protein
MTVETEEARLKYDPKTSPGGPEMKESIMGAEEGIEQRLWELALDSPLEEVARALYHLTPDVPLTPDLRLHWAIFGRRAIDYRAGLVEMFVLLNRPKGEWEDYKERCIAWVTDLLQDAVAQETGLVEEAVRQLLATLPDRLRAVLWVRFGFDGHGPRTLEQVGKEFGLSKERVRQLEVKALRMLRHPSRSRYLRHVLPGERFRAMVFAELGSYPAVPAVFLMWRDDRAALLSLRKSMKKLPVLEAKEKERDGNGAKTENPEKHGHEGAYREDPPV